MNVKLKKIYLNKGGLLKKRRTVIILCAVIALICLIPIPMHLKDGGTVKYQALLYSVSKVHRLAPVEASKDYEEGTIISVLGFEVYCDVE